MSEITTNKIAPLNWISSTWIASGIPFIALSSTAAIMYDSLGLPDDEIAFWTSFIMLPWALKFLWAPLLEMFMTKRYFVYVSQFFLGALFALVSVSLIADSFFGLSIGLFTAIAFAAATQDLAADGIYINELNQTEQQQYMGWQVVFKNIAKVLFGPALVALAFVIEESYGLKAAWMTIMMIYALAMMLLGVISAYNLPVGGKAVHTVESAPEAVVIYWDVVVQFFKKQNLAIGLFFIFFYRLAEAQAIKIAPLFFTATRIEGGLAFDQEETNFTFNVLGVIAFVLGSFVSGYFVAARTFNRKTLLFLCTAMNLSLIIYAYLALFQPVDEMPIMLMVAFQHFCYGFGLLALVFFILQEITPGKYRLAYFSFASAVMYLAYIIPAMFSGLLSEYMGFYDFYIWILICTLPAYFMSAVVPLKNIHHATAS
ncbi:hypothetical protein [Sediminibacterium sp.]|uniref:hypothetical protein n=1 Tax=Sediminibacterium sp. TaxID=1917865 RepID=UPI003F70486D